MHIWALQNKRWFISLETIYEKALAEIVGKLIAHRIPLSNSFFGNTSSPFSFPFTLQFVSGYISSASLLSEQENVGEKSAVNNIK